MIGSLIAIENISFRITFIVFFSKRVHFFASVKTAAKCLNMHIFEIMIAYSESLIENTYSAENERLLLPQ